jgi:hypothetical protein
MFDCDQCGESAELAYQCNYCGGRYCSEHRLPEGHSCDGVEFLSGTRGWFRSKESGDVVSSSAEMKSPDPIKPEYTVGATPSADYESSPEVTVTADEDGPEDDRHVIVEMLRKLFGTR